MTAFVPVGNTDGSRMGSIEVKLDVGVLSLDVGVLLGLLYDDRRDLLHAHERHG